MQKWEQARRLMMLKNYIFIQSLVYSRNDALKSCVHKMWQVWWQLGLDTSIHKFWLIFLQACRWTEQTIEVLLGHSLISTFTRNWFLTWLHRITKLNHCQERRLVGYEVHRKVKISNNQVLSFEIILLFDICLFSFHFHVLRFVHHRTIDAFWVSLANMTNVYN